MNRADRYFEIMRRSEIEIDEQGPVASISLEDLLALEEIKNSCFIGVESAIYLGSSVDVPGQPSLPDAYWRLSAPDFFATANVIHYTDGGGFYVSIEFPHEPFWREADAHEAPKEVCEAVFRLLPDRAVTQIFESLRANEHWEEAEVQEIIDWISASRSAQSTSPAKP